MAPSTSSLSIKFHLCASFNSVDLINLASGNGIENKSTCSMNQSRHPASRDGADVLFGVGGALARASLPRGLVALVPLSAVSLFQLFYPPCSVCSVRPASCVLIAPAVSETRPGSQKEQFPDKISTSSFRQWFSSSPVRLR